MLLFDGGGGEFKGLEGILGLGFEMRWKGKGLVSISVGFWR